MKGLELYLIVINYNLVDMVQLFKVTIDAEEILHCILKNKIQGFTMLHE